MTRASGLLARPLPKEPAPRDEVAPRPWLLPWTLTVAAGTLGPYLPVHPDQGLALLGPCVPIWKVGGFKLDPVNPLFSIPLARSLSPWFPAWSHPASSHFLPSPGRLRSGFAAHPLLYLWLPAPPCSCSSASRILALVKCPAASCLWGSLHAVFLARNSTLPVHLFQLLPSGIFLIFLVLHAV